jgi:carotenoid cleavage dioxygenase-like enzyme
MEAFSIAAALATAVQGRALIVLHLLPTGYNPVRDAVSDYGADPEQTLNDREQEFPRVDDRVISRPYQYGYSAMIGGVSQAISPLTGDFADEEFTNALLKHELTHGTAETHDFGQHATAGEAVFAPAAPGAAEGDGYVFAYVHNPDRGASELVILVAQDFTAAPVARVHLPARIPLGFHRSWLADQDHGPDR